MSALIHQRCFNHAIREAVARCPECARFYCRECVTEHDERLLCAECVRKSLGMSAGRRRRFAGVVRLLQFGTAFLVAWLFFFWIGQILLSLDPAFHEGTVWKERWWPGFGATYFDSP